MPQNLIPFFPIIFPNNWWPTNLKDCVEFGYRLRHAWQRRRDYYVIEILPRGLNIKELMGQIKKHEQTKKERENQETWSVQQRRLTIYIGCAMLQWPRFLTWNRWWKQTKYEDGKDFTTLGIFKNLKRRRRRGKKTESRQWDMKPTYVSLKLHQYVYI